MAETTPLLRVQLLTGARGFESLPVRHHTIYHFLAYLNAYNMPFLSHITPYFLLPVSKIAIIFRNTALLSALVSLE